MKHVAIIFALALLNCLIIYSCSRSSMIQVRVIEAKLTRMQIVSRYNQDDKLRLYFQEVNGWKIDFSEDFHPLSDTSLYKVGAIYAIRLNK